MPATPEAEMVVELAGSTGADAGTRPAPVADVPPRGTPQHATLTADTVETFDLEGDFAAVEVVASGAAVTFRVDGQDPTTTSGHLVLDGGALAVRTQEHRVGGVTQVRVLGASGATPTVVVTGLDIG